MGQGAKSANDQIRKLQLIEFKFEGIHCCILTKKWNCVHCIFPIDYLDLHHQMLMISSTLCRPDFKTIDEPS